ncbi:MAG TPA: hypothetical protein DET40_17125 [Lentisphaeria bacterium]|nr:hypothetical protein [Lentisphaeria bacterium]
MLRELRRKIIGVFCAVSLLGSFCADAETLSLSNEGIVIDKGADGKFEITYPVFVDNANKNVKIMDKSVKGSKATLKFEGGGQIDLELKGGEVQCSPSDVPGNIAKFGCSMQISNEYGRGGKWIIGGTDEKEFPKAKPDKPFLFQGNQSKLILISPSGARTEFAIPEYSYQQLQDNREWGWNIYQWHFWTPFNKDNPNFAIRVGGAAAPAPAAGTPVFRVDRFGQIVKEKIVNRISGEDELKKDVEDEKAYYESLKPPVFDRFGGLPDSGAKMGLNKTGFFHVEKKDGKWILVNPDGNAFFHLGVCSFGPVSWTYVEGRESTFEWIPPHDKTYESAWSPDKWWNSKAVSYQLANMIRKYGEPVTMANFQDRMIDRVRKWGFNSVGAFSGVDRETMTKKNFPYVSALPSASGWNGIQSLPDIRETFDPFDEKTVAEFDKQCSNIAKNADDPMLIGYFITNEPTHEAVPRVIPTLKNVPVKKRLVQFLEEKYKTVDACNKAWKMNHPDFKAMEGVGLPVTTKEASEDMQAFTAFFFETLFKLTYDTVKKYDRNHMIIGSRWQPSTANNEQLCRIAGKYTDIVSVNYYTYGVDKDYLDRIYKWSGEKPMFLSEFYWSSSSDSGVGPFKDVNNQQERGLAYRNYLENTASLGYVVGVEWFTLVDAPCMGVFYSKYDGERPNCGLISVTDRPWKDMLAEMMKSNYEIYKLEFEGKKPFVFDDPRFSSKAGGKQKITVARTPSPMKIDGERGDWPGLPPEMISGKRLVEGASAGEAEANFRLAYDDSNLYIHVEVTDATPMQNKNTKDMLWSGDGLELFIGSENIEQGGALRFTDRQILLGAGAPDGKGQVWFANSPEQVECKMAVVPRVDGKGYVIEAAIPLSALGLKPKKGQEILFDLAVDNSADGKGRKSQLMWNGISRNSSDRSAWGRAVFGE